jgi:hypothetical protein
MGLGWPARFHRRPGLLRGWLWRLLCAAIGPDALGTPLAAGKSLLLSAVVRFSTSKSPGAAEPGLFQVISRWNHVPLFMQFLLEGTQSTREAKQFPSP